MQILTQEDIFTCLKTVIDPELHINIVDLGLIYNVTLTKEEGTQKVHILMTLTSPGCPLGTMIVRMMRDSLAVYPFLNPEQDVRVEIVFDPPWVQDMISEEAKAELGF